MNFSTNIPYIKKIILKSMMERRLQWENLHVQLTPHDETVLFLVSGHVTRTFGFPTEHWSQVHDTQTSQLTLNASILNTHAL